MKKVLAYVRWLIHQYEYGKLSTLRSDFYYKEYCKGAVSALIRVRKKLEKELAKESK